MYKFVIMLVCVIGYVLLYCGCLPLPMFVFC